MNTLEEMMTETITKRFTYTIYRPGQEPERGEVDWPETPDHEQVKAFVGPIINCRKSVAVGTDATDGLKMFVSLLQPRVHAGPDMEYIAEMVGYMSQWDIWDEVLDMTQGNDPAYETNETATALYREWLRDDECDEAEIAQCTLVGPAVVFDEPVRWT
jgi:hypothetical protein